MASSVPPCTIGPNGVIVPPQTGSGSILAGVLADMNTAFGGNLNITNLSTPQGQLASSIAAYIADKNALYAYFVSQTDPQYAQGFMQDALGRLFNITRLPATFTTVTGLCSGAAGTVIPNGAQAQDTSGNLYTTTGGTIGVGGSVSLVFTAVVSGPVSCPAGALTRIMTTTPGWDSVTNPTGTDTLPLTLGLVIESASAFEARRQLSLFANAQSMTQSIAGAVLASGASIPNYPTDCLVFDNSSTNPTTFGGITVPANSLYIAVQGGDPASIARAIWSKKSVGASYAPSASFTASTATNVLTVTAVAYGFLSVGQTITGAGIPAGTTIVSLGSGTGGTGTYNLSTTPGTVGSETMTAATVVVIQDTAFFTPSPSYAVQYTTPQQVPIYVAVSLINLTSLPANALAAIQTAIANAFQGLDGGPKARIGATIFGTRFYAPILAAIPQAQIVSILVGTSASPTNPSVTPNANQYPVTGSSYITLTLV